MLKAIKTMPQIAGFLLILGLVMGALASVGGGAMAALPFELALIGGAALGTVFLANSPAVARAALAGFGKVVRGAKWTSEDYVGLLVLGHDLMQTARRGGMVAIEADIETPETSLRFATQPKLRADGDACGLICDTLRLLSLDPASAQRLDEAMARAISMRIERRFRAVNALHAVADALPALGIVAAVIGIIRAMAVIDQAPNVIGAMIAAALLGTFLGVFLAYGLVGPVAARLGQIVEEEAQFLEVIGAMFAAFAQGLPARTAVEIGRTAAPADLQPSADDLARALETQRFVAHRREGPRNVA